MTLGQSACAHANDVGVVPGSAVDRHWDRQLHLPDSAGETLVAPGGEPVAFDAAQDLLRVSFYPEQGLSSINYQYVPRAEGGASLRERGAGQDGGVG